MMQDAKANVNAVYAARYINERGYNRNTVEIALHQVIGSRRGKDKEKDTKERLRLMMLLLDAGADINNERKELVQEHVEVESPTDDPREDGYIPSVRCIPRRETPLLMAIRLGLAEEARLLVLRGADTSAKYHYGKETKTAEELAAGNEELLAALHCKWQPQYHRLYPASVRQSIFTALCVIKRQAWPLPVELVHQIFQWVATPPAAKDTEKVKDEGQEEAQEF